MPRKRFTASANIFSAPEAHGPRGVNSKECQIAEVAPHPRTMIHGKEETTIFIPPSTW
jgi:hypothetical protein